MLKLVLAASAVALASVMAISTGPARAQSLCPTTSEFIDGPHWGMMRPPCEDRFFNYGTDRYVNYGGSTLVEPAPIVSGRSAVSDFVDGPTWGLMRPPVGRRFVNYGGIEGDHIAACEARYRSYDAETDTFLGYDGLEHACEL